MTEYVVTNPEGKEFVVTAPEGATQEQALEFAKSKFQSTPGGAAVGSPNIERWGRQNLKSDATFDPLIAIGGASAIGGGMGAFSKEILTGAGNVIGSFPYPAARTIGGFLKGTGQIIGAGGRAAPAIAGAISGGAGETAWQAAEALGAGPVTAEAVRFVGAGIAPEGANLAKWVMEKYVTKPALSIGMHIKKLTAKSILEKLDRTESLSEKELKFVNEQIESLRGRVPEVSVGKTDAPLEAVGSIMGAEGDRLLDVADKQMVGALRQAAGAKLPTSQVQMADIGKSLQNTINTRYKGALQARSAAYKTNEQARDALVSQREKAGSFVNTLPEYQAVIKELEAQLANEDIMRRSPSVQASYRKILSDLTNPKTTEAQKKLILSGQNLDLIEVPGQSKPISFQALDDVRRKLGDAFRGKPAEGYDAIGEKAAKDLYGKVSEIQKKFAGGSTGPQAKLLDDYAERTEGLQIFSSKFGKKSTALDQYREDTFATDPSFLPAAYFKTRASIKALKELVGNEAQVQNAALEFANKQLAGKDASEVRKWMGSNAEWLSEARVTQRLVDKYAIRLEGVERAFKNAEDFAKQAAKDSSLLTRQSLPAQRAIDLIKSGDTEFWSKVTPAIVKSPQAKTQMVNAVRQVVASQATNKGTIDLFSRNIRPFLEQSGIGSKAEMDFILQKLVNIQEMKIPEPEKLGIAKRIILQAAGGWAATAASRTGKTGYEFAIEKEVPQ